MRHLFIRIYAFISMLSIFFIVGMFVFHIIDDISKEVNNATITFHKFEKAVAYEVNRSLLEDETSRHRLRTIAKILDMKGFVIQIAPNEGRTFSYPSDSSLFSVINGNVLIKEHSKFLKVFKTENYVTIADKSQKVYITAITNIFPSNMFFVRSRTVFFFALALVLLTGLIRILLSVKPSQKVEKVYTTFDKKTEPTKHSDISYKVPSPTFAEGISTLESSNDLGTYTTIKDSQSDVSHNKNLTSNNVSVSSTFPDNISKTKDAIYLNEEPRGLYSPTTGFGWKKYLTERLRSEIERSTATDQDMSFAIIKIRDIDFYSLNMESISNIILEAFKFRDMIFEYSDEITLGFAVILQDIYIDRTLKICDSLFSKLKSEIYLTGQEPTIGIGVTTRACRLTNERVMLHEAEAAVSHALENEDDPIVGFRPSAEKYRQKTIEERD